MKQVKNYACLIGSQTNDDMLPFRLLRMYEMPLNTKSAPLTPRSWTKKYASFGRG